MRLSSGSPGIPTGMVCARLILLSLVAALYFSGSSAAPSNGEFEVCHSEGCKDIADEYLSSMDPTVEPCEDFYKYACGNWPKSHQPSNHSPRWSHFGIIANKTKFRLKEILESGWNADETVSVVKAKQLYRACMDERTIELKGTSDIHRFLRLNGGWPILSIPSPFERFNQKRSWQTVDSYYNSLLGKSSIFSLTVTQDLNDSEKNVLTLTPPLGDNPQPEPISANIDAIFDDPNIAGYKNYITAIVKSMARSGGSIVSATQLDRDAKGIILFESYLRSILVPPIKDLSATPDFHTLQKTLTISQLQAVYNSANPQTSRSQINWLQRIRELFANVDSVSINKSERIILFGDYYFEKLVAILDHTLERDIVNTIHWWFVKQTIEYAGHELTSITDNYMRSTRPPGAAPPPQAPRWLKCITSNELQHAVSYAYVQKHFPENAKETALEMVKQIEIEMKNQITQSKWLDEESKKAAQEKIAHMARFIGYPDWYNSPVAMDERYRKLAIGSFYLQNMLLVGQFALRLKLESLRKPVDKWAWIASPVAINAFYSPPANSITFPAAMLQMPFFDAESPDAINYGGIGAVIAHEISHGFDNVGSQFDKDGNAREWWSNGTREEYTKRTECFVDQFNSFGLYINNVIYKGFGVHTLGENIADSTGMRAVFDAFKSHVKDSGNKEIKLPGLEHLTREQLFFLSYAESMCENTKPEVLLHMAKTDPHSAAPFRVIGTLSNTEGFAEAFKCGKGTIMNPSNRCGIWYR